MWKVVISIFLRATMIKMKWSWARRTNWTSSQLTRWCAKFVWKPYWLHKLFFKTMTFYENLCSRRKLHLLLGKICKNFNPIFHCQPKLWPIWEFSFIKFWENFRPSELLRILPCIRRPGVELLKTKLLPLAKYKRNTNWFELFYHKAVIHYLK